MQLTRHARAHQYWPSAGWVPQALMTLSSHSGPTQLITAEQVKEMSVEDHQQIWKVLGCATHQTVYCTPKGSTQCIDV